MGPFSRHWICWCVNTASFSHLLSSSISFLDVFKVLVFHFPGQIYFLILSTFIYLPVDLFPDKLIVGILKRYCFLSVCWFCFLPFPLSNKCFLMIFKVSFKLKIILSEKGIIQALFPCVGHIYLINSFVFILLAEASTLYRIKIKRADPLFHSWLQDFLHLLFCWLFILDM